MRVLRPIEMTDAMVIENSVVPEDASAVWVAGQPANSYALGDLCHRVGTHRVYERVKTEAGTAAENTPPEQDPTHWKNLRPTNRWAAFDPWRLAQKSTFNGQMRWVIRPGQFVDSVWVGGIAGASSYTVIARAGGVEYFRQDGDMEGAMRTDWYRYWTEPFTVASDVLAVGMPLRPNPEIEIVLDGPADVSVGFVCLAKMAVLGYTRFGAKSRVIDYNTIKYGVDGEVDIKLRGSAKELEATCRVKLVDARYVDQVMESVRGRPAVFIGADLAVYEALRVYGIGSGGQSYDNPKFNTLDIKIKGI